MSTSFTTTASTTFTLLHAKQLASRVSADMKRCQQLYGYPSTDAEINDFATELAHLLNGGYVSEYEFGFKREGKRIISCHYRVKDGDLAASNDRPGGIQSGVDITGAVSFNFLTTTSKWAYLPEEEKNKVRAILPINRTAGHPPADGLGYWQEDKQYSAAGTLLTRRVFKPYMT